MAGESPLVDLSAGLGFDPDVLREKYKSERDKRIRKDGNEQYRGAAGELASYLDDPAGDPGYERESLDEETESVIEHFTAKTRVSDPPQKYAAVYSDRESQPTQQQEQERRERDEWEAGRRRDAVRRRDAERRRLSVRNSRPATRTIWPQG